MCRSDKARAELVEELDGCINFDLSGASGAPLRERLRQRPLPSPFSRRRTFWETGSLARFREFIELSPAAVSGCVANFSIAFPPGG